MYKDNFNSGEVGTNFWRRPDLAVFQNGCAKAQNFVPLVEGPLRRRAGFWHNGLPKLAGTACLVVEYVRAIDDAYVVELGDQYTRFWGVDGQPIKVGNAPYEIVQPFGGVDLPGLRWKQLGNVILFFHKDGRRPQRLQKVSETSWNWSAYDFVDGPWQAENTDLTRTIAVSAATSTPTEFVTVTSSFDLFTPQMIGTRFRLRSSNGLPGVRTWQADETPRGNAVRLSNGRVYYADSHPDATKTGNTPPSHDLGKQGDGGIDWYYLHDGSGVIEVTAYTNARQVTAFAYNHLPTLGKDYGEGKGLEYRPTAPSTDYAIPATFAWSQAAYSDFSGWPTAWPELREERLIVGGGRQAPDKFDASQSAGYYANNASFKPGLGTGTVQADDGIQGFAGDDSFKIMGFVSAALMVAFTHGGEAAIVGDTAEAALTPGSAKPRALSRFGSADVRPIKAQDATLFVTRGNRSLRDLAPSAFDYPGPNSDTSFIAKHIGRRKFMEVAFTAAPDYMLWARLGDGGLASMVYNREQNVRGWSTHVLGGGCVVESLCVVPDVIGNDRLWAVVKRTKNNQVQRMIWMMSDPDDRMRLDGAVRYLGALDGNGNRAKATAVAGAAHLNGETVPVAAGPGDGRYAWAGHHLVTGGVVSLTEDAAEEIIVGLPYTSRFESLPLAQATAQGAKMRVATVDAAYEGVTVSAGTVNGGDPDVFEDRLPTDIDALTPQEIVVSLTMASDHELDPRIFIEIDGVYDLTLKSYDVKFHR